MRRIFVTRRCEYHCIGGVCVAVRDRPTRAFVAHEAIGRRCALAFRRDSQGNPDVTAVDRQDLGQRLLFSDEEGFVTTSPIIAVLDGCAEFFEPDS
jgi:hypothetical protein